MIEGFHSHQLEETGTAAEAERVTARRSRILDAFQMVVLVVGPPVALGLVVAVVWLAFAFDGVSRRADTVVGRYSDLAESNRKLADSNRDLATFARLAQQLLTASTPEERAAAAAGLDALRQQETASGTAPTSPTTPAPGSTATTTRTTVTPASPGESRPNPRPSTTTTSPPSRPPAPVGPPVVCPALPVTLTVCPPG